MKDRSASAVWKGGLKNGLGHVSTEAGALNNGPYNFGMRFEDQKGTNPEELIRCDLKRPGNDREGATRRPSEISSAGRSREGRLSNFQAV